MKKKTPKQAFAIQDLLAPWNTNQNSIWLLSTLKLLRNLDPFLFPHKLSDDEKERVLTILESAFGKRKKENFDTSIRAESLSAEEREFLIEHYLLFDGMFEARKGSGVVLDDSGQKIALLNFKDHLQIQYTDLSSHLDQGYQTLVSIEQELAKHLRFSFSEKFGYLTSDHLHCGTAFIVSSYLHLPALIHTDALVETIEKEKSEGILATGIQGNPNELIGDFVMIRNMHTLGVAEEHIIKTMQNASLHLVLSEEQKRKEIKKEKNPHFIDMISRAVGLLKYSYEMAVPESLDALSQVKLGIELGWIKGIDLKEVNWLLFSSRRSHLKALDKKAKSGKEVLLKRAEYLQRAFKAVELKVK